MPIQVTAPNTIEEAREVILAYQNAERDLETNVAALTTENTAAKAKVIEVQEYNNKLFMQLQTPPATKPDEEKPLPLDELVESLKGAI
jgi:hypothetical protein